MGRWPPWPIPPGPRGRWGVPLRFRTTVPWQRVINSYGGLSTYKVGSGELRRALLEKEGYLQIGWDPYLKKYKWQPGLRVIKKLKLPEEIAFQINARLPFSQNRFKRIPYQEK